MSDPTPTEVAAAGLLGLGVVAEVVDEHMRARPAWFVYAAGRPLGSYVPGTGRWWANGESGEGSWAAAVPAFVRAAGRMKGRKAA